MTIDSQKNIREFSVQAFRKVCDQALFRLPDSVRDPEAGWDERRLETLRFLQSEVYKYANATDSPMAVATAGAFMLTHGIIESLGKYWHVHSMNLETIIDEFVINAIGRKQ
jgi:hypothetical protein